MFEIETLENCLTKDSPYSYETFEDDEVIWLQLKEGQKKEDIITFWEKLSTTNIIHSDAEYPQKILEGAIVKIKASKDMSQFLAIETNNGAVNLSSSLKRVGEDVFLQASFELQLNQNFDERKRDFQSHDVDLQKGKWGVIALIPVENIAEIAFFDPYYFLHDPDDGDFYEPVENPWDDRI